MIRLKITTRLIDEVISTNLDSPPYVFHLSEGQDIRDIRYPKRIGGWALHWVNTKGKTTQGSIVLVPNNHTTTCDTIRRRRGLSGIVFRRRNLRNFICRPLREIPKSNCRTNNS